MTANKDKIRMILKFDTGADGFLRMIYVLIGAAFFVLLAGGAFFLFAYQNTGTTL